MTGLEALARWQHPERGGRCGEFIRVAEDTGMIHALGRWVLRRHAASTPLAPAGALEDDSGSP